MLQRGRKSSEGLSVVRVAPHERVAPPDRLGGDESTIWREIVSSKPADWFGPDNLTALRALLQRVRLIRQHRLDPG